MSVRIDVTCQCGDCGLLWKPQTGDNCPRCALRALTKRMRALSADLREREQLAPVAERRLIWEWRTAVEAALAHVNSTHGVREDQ